jgi:Ca-activated chloride channel family protein
MTFGAPTALAALLLIPLLLAFLAWAGRRRQAAVERLGAPALVAALSASVNRRGRRLATRLWLVAVALLVLSLARPQWGTQSETVEQQGIQVMVALDVSESMLAEDVKPSRLDRAKLEIADLMNRMGGDEIGLVLFSGAAFIQFPLTSDYAVARSFLESARPGVISRGGTAIGEAIRSALTGFDQRRPGQKVIVIFTDGEDRESDATAAAAEANDQGVVVYTVGMGSPEGAQIPVFDASGAAVDVKRDRAGEIVVSQLDEAGLQRIAESGGGHYFRAGAASGGAVGGTGGGIADLADELASLQAGTTESRIEVQRVERFQLFLGLGVLLLVAIELVPERRRIAPLVLAVCAGLSLTLTGCGATAADQNEAGNRAYQAEDYAAAEAAYEAAQAESPDSAALAYNLGNTAFRQQDVDTARRRLQEALVKDEGSLTAQAFFNLGHLAFNVQQYDAAIEAYKAVLRLTPDDVDAKVNLELALQQQQAQAEQDEQEQQDQQDQEQADQQDQQQQDQQQGDGQEQQQADQGQQNDPSQSQSGEQSPDAQATQQAGGQGEGQPTPQDQAGQQGQQGDPNDPSQPEDQSAAGDPSNRDPSDRNPAGGTAGRQLRGLTATEARRLLRAIGGNARTLQEFLQQQYIVPNMSPPEQDW